MTDAHFETAVATAKETAGQVTTAFMLREAARAKPQGQPKKGAKADAIREELKAAKERGVSQLETYARLTLSALRCQDSFTEQEQTLLAELMGPFQPKFEGDPPSHAGIGWGRRQSPAF